MEIAFQAVLNEAAFQHLLVEFYPDMLHLALSILHQRAEAEDATQLALEHAWRSRAQLRDPNSLLYWLRKIVVREALRARSARRRDGEWPHVTEIDPGRDHDGPKNHERVDVLSALETLPPDQSAVVVLHHYLGYSVAEVAAMVGVPVETVRSRLRLAMARLREGLQDV